ncbi:MAG: hypothetical protein PHV82_00825 [Victivallaceae bacterium]|nr:hypothetical protein [Victivallaceae bacterium]
MLCSLTLCGTIFPAPLNSERNINVAVSLWNGYDGGGLSVNNSFRRREYVWVSFSPCALITVPGESDFPKISEAFNMGRFAYNDIPQVAQQIAAVTARAVTGKSPVHWKAGVRALKPAVLPKPQDSAMPVPVSAPRTNDEPF